VVALGSAAAVVAVKSVVEGRPIPPPTISVDDDVGYAVDSTEATGSAAKLVVESAGPTSPRISSRFAGVSLIGEMRL
jgi:hypothetical protein